MEQLRDLLHVQADETHVKLKGLITWLAMTLQVHTRLWLGAVVSPHREALSCTLLQKECTCALAQPLPIAMDGWSSYFSAIQAAFRPALLTRERGRSRLFARPDIHTHHAGDQGSSRAIGWSVW